MSDVITAEAYLGMVACGARRLGAKRKTINDLNVFPIPDGDTGDNMYMTIGAGVRNGLPEAGADISLGELAGRMSRGMLMGARGNSGVILSRIFAGISMGLEGLESADLDQFRGAMLKGVKEAYGAVSHPVEGTILTVIRESVEKAASTGNNPTEYFIALVQEMRESLKRTPELLGVLKEAGVVDSGGAGMLCIAEGMLEYFEKAGEVEQVLSSSSEAPSPACKYNLDDFGPDTVLEFGYCTEFLLRLQNAKVGDVETFDVREIKDWLTENGESVVCFKDGSIVKVHVHTMDPGSILTKARQWGEFLTLKIENMTLQHSEVTIQDNFSVDADDEVLVAKKKYGIVAVATGAGLVQSFKDAGADVVIEGGQTMNPSAGSFVDAFNKINAETIFVFPNNSNVIMTAQQAADCWIQEKGRKVIVLKSKDPASGYVALAGMDLSDKDADSVMAGAEASIASTVTAMVSRATRDAIMDGIEIHKDDFIGIGNGRIIAADKDRRRLATMLSEAIGMKDSDVALIFHGADVSSEEAAGLAEDLQAQNPRTEIMMNNGNQPVFDYIIALC